MQVMGDGLSVLGSRHGLMWDPFQRQTYLVRFDRHPGIPIALHVGVRLSERTVVLPLCPEGAVFEFIDQEMHPTCMVMTGIDPAAALKVRLEVRIPFRPRDAAFSTVPVYYLTAQVSRLDKAFRWRRTPSEAVSGELFIEIDGQALTLQPQGSDLDVTLSAPVSRPFGAETTAEAQPQIVQERLVILAGEASASGAAAPFSLLMGQTGPQVQLAWCACAPAILSVFDELSPFRYTQEFAGLDEVAVWAHEHAAEVADYGAWFDEVIGDHSLGSTLTHLCAQTLHAWLIDTWWVRIPSNGREWFSVWEGSCYFHSTVDVEFTQGPFYLSLWPELLRLELDEWPSFSKDGTICLGERGENTLLLAHDMGLLASCGKQAYPHDMEIEEVTNYLLLAYAYWRRTGDRSIQITHSETMRRYLDFVLACDTTGNGVPDKGCTNTIDDASPAVQYGREQVYLAVKALGALRCGADMLADVGYVNLTRYRRQAERIRKAVDSKGWLGDHYAVTLDPSAEGLNDPWSGEPMHGDLPGWDACHIYTMNALAILDMVGCDLKLNEDHLALDALIAAQRTLGRYGCRHTDYDGAAQTAVLTDGMAITGGKTGWVSMNMVRDIAAAYRGVDLLAMVERYWDWQATTNAREARLFFETFGGNALCFYPRGVAVWGYFDAAAGLVYDRVAGTREVNALRQTTRVPLLALADWANHQVPLYES